MSGNAGTKRARPVDAHVRARIRFRRNLLGLSQMEPKKDWLRFYATRFPTTEINGSADHDRLAKLSGEKFDRAFIKHMVADHKKDIREFQQEAKKTNEAPAGYAKDSLPTLQKHLQTAQSLEGTRATTGSRQ